MINNNNNNAQLTSNLNTYSTRDHDSFKPHTNELYVHNKVTQVTGESMAEADA